MKLAHVRYIYEETYLEVLISIHNLPSEHSVVDRSVVILVQHFLRLSSILLRLAFCIRARLGFGLTRSLS